jgi:hypothetical protein
MMEAMVNIHGTLVPMTHGHVQMIRDEVDKAITEGAETFMLWGNEVIIGYAKYLADYIEMSLEQKGVKK